MKRLTRTVQRTPNLGLTLKMQKPTAAESACCEPKIGPARWWNPATGEYDAEILVVHAEYDGYLVRWAGDTEEETVIMNLFHAIVTGDLCGSVVDMSVNIQWASDGIE